MCLKQPSSRRKTLPATWETRLSRNPSLRPYLMVQSWSSYRPFLAPGQKRKSIQISVVHSYRVVSISYSNRPPQDLCISPVRRPRGQVAVPSPVSEVASLNRVAISSIYLKACFRNFKGSHRATSTSVRRDRYVWRLRVFSASFGLVAPWLPPNLP